MNEEENNTEQSLNLEQRVKKLEERLDNLKLKKPVQEAIDKGTNKLIVFQEDIKSKLETEETKINNKLQELHKILSMFDKQIEENQKNILSNIERKYSEKEKIIKEIESLKSHISEVLEDVKDSQETITNFYNECIEPEKGKNNIKSQINELFTELDSIISDSKSKIDEWEKYSKTEESKILARINSLLPKAGMAGLSASYKESKEKYGIKIESWDKKNEKYAYSCPSSIGNFLTSFFYYLLVVPAIWVFTYNITHNIDLDQITTSVIIYKMVISLPLTALAIFGVYSILSRRKMYEAYNHKQRVMQMYIAFTKELENSTDQSTIDKLNTIVLKTIDYDPHLKIKEPLDVVKEFISKTDVNK